MKQTVRNYTKEISKNKMRTLLMFIGCILLFTQCKDEKLKMNYTYIDQNNNRYYISQFNIDYRPIKASESSSGIYSGGDEASVSVSEEKYNEVVTIAEEFLTNKDNENIKREMLTSVLYSKDQHDNKRKVVLRSSEKRTKLENLLKDAIKK